MKIVRLLNDYRPQRKCGAGAAAAIGIGSAVAGLVSSGVSNAVSASNVNKQLSAQENENQLNRDWQTAEAEKARQFSAGQTLQQNQFVSGLQAQQQQYNMQSMREQARLNSPVYQRAQLEAAGINPEVYFGKSSSFSGVSAQSGGAPSAPSPGGTYGVGSVAGLSPIGFQPRDLQLGLFGTQLAQQLKDLAEAKRTGVQTGLLPEETAARIRSLNSQSSLNEVFSVGEDIRNKLNNAKLPYAYKMAALEVDRSVAELKLTEQNKFTAESVEKVNKALEKLHNAQKNLTDREAQKLGIEMPLYFQYLKSSINKNTAEASQAFANAESIKFFNDLRQKPDIKDALCNEIIQASIAATKANKMSDVQMNQIKQYTEQLRKATDNYEIQMWSGIINQTINTAANAIGEFTRFGLAKKFLDSKPSSFDGNAGRGYYMNDGLLFVNPVK